MLQCISLYRDFEDYIFSELHVGLDSKHVGGKIAQCMPNTHALPTAADKIALPKRVYINKRLLMGYLTVQFPSIRLCHSPDP
jgi:hypothetical protein